MRTIVLAAACLLSFPAVGASVADGGDPAAAAVAALGRVNGRALACGHLDVSRRVRAAVVAGVAKTRAAGEAFEAATSEAFLAQGRDKAACPSAEVLAVELTVLARPLAPSATHSPAPGGEPAEADINPRYLLQASNGRAITDGDFRQQFQLITFGYTFCPDVCPTTLLEMAEIMKQLGEQAVRVQPLFFTVDPERDTPEKLRAYAEFFDRRIIAASGSPELVGRAAANFRVRYAKVPAPGADPAHYAVDHTAGIYLLAPGGGFVSRFPYRTPVAEVVARLRREIAAWPAFRPVSAQ